MTVVLYPKRCNSCSHYNFIKIKDDRNNLKAHNHAHCSTSLLNRAKNSLMYTLYKLPASTNIRINSRLNRFRRSYRETRPQPIIDSPLYTVPTRMRRI